MSRIISSVPALPLKMPSLMNNSLIRRALRFFPIVLSLALLVSPVATLAQSNTGVLLTTFTNPVPPLGDDLFGTAIASVGSERIIFGILDDTGAAGAGAVQLYNTSGVLLTTFTNPTPSMDDFFGCSVAALGSDRFVVGAYLDDTGADNAGAAYLFNTNGTLLATFTNPTPAIDDGFGVLVAAVGKDRVLIASWNDSTGASHAGAAYLFNTNGVLLTTFTNPTPASFDTFSSAIAGVGTDRVLIGASDDDAGAANSGVAYLFRTNGTLLTTIVNPSPAADDGFGWAVAAVGNDRLLIGAYRDDTGASDSGSAYLFNTNGTLLTTFTNPTPANGDWFGYTVATVGTDRILIGAQLDDVGVVNAGVAYLFNTNGALLTIFTNPVPTIKRAFGYAMAALGSDQVIIGTFGTPSGGPGAGAGTAYLFALPYPPLSITRNATTVSLKWVTPETGLTLQQASALSSSTAWSNTSDSVSINGPTNVVQQTMVATNRFFRLNRP